MMHGRQGEALGDLRQLHRVELLVFDQGGPGRCDDIEPCGVSATGTRVQSGGRQGWTRPPLPTGCQTFQIS